MNRPRVAAPQAMDQTGPRIVINSASRTSERQREVVHGLRQQLGVADDVPDADLRVTVTGAGIEVIAQRGPEDLVGGHPLRINWSAVNTAPGAGASLKQPIARAVGLRKGDPYRPHVVDATAGLGEDTWLLACLGCEATAIERHPLIAAMLREELATHAAALNQRAASRITIKRGDAAELLPRLDPRPEVVYLDPMFPTGRRGKEKKAMRLLRVLVGDDSDADALLEAARASATRRVVVKRPNKAPPLAGAEPTATHKARALRYDVYAVG